MDIQTFNKALHLKNVLDECLKNEERAINSLNYAKTVDYERIIIGDLHFYVEKELAIEIAQKVVDYCHEKRVKAEHNFRIL